MLGPYRPLFPPRFQIARMTAVRNLSTPLRTSSKSLTAMPCSIRRPSDRTRFCCPGSNAPEFTKKVMTSLSLLKSRLLIPTALSRESASQHNVGRVARSRTRARSEFSDVGRSTCTSQPQQRSLTAPPRVVRGRLDVVEQVAPWRPSRVSRVLSRVDMVSVAYWRADGMASPPRSGHRRVSQRELGLPLPRGSCGQAVCCERASALAAQPHSYTRGTPPTMKNDAAS